MNFRTLNRAYGSAGTTHQTPIIWLGQNLRNRVLLAEHDELKSSPILVSMGDAFLRPSYKDRFFTEHLRESLGMTGPLMVDSGGYALLARRSLRCSIKELERIYLKLPADILVSLDCPPSPSDDQVKRSTLRRRTLRNLEILSHIIPPERLMPVAHGHTVKEVERSCEAIKLLCPNASQIGMGGLVPLIRSGGSVGGFRYVRKNGTPGDRGQWIGDAIEIVHAYFPQALVHVFGVGSATTAIGVLALGADSADSLSWRRVANYGAILLPGRSERFPLFCEERVHSRPVLRDEDLGLVAACECPVCSLTNNIPKRLSALAGCYKHRAIHNAWTVLTEVAALRTAIKTNRVRAFLTSRLSARHRLYKPVIERLNACETVQGSIP